MTDVSSNRSHGRTPSDEQMDGLLREFFRLETPTELNQPLLRVQSEPKAELSPTIAPAVQSDASTSRRRRVFVVSAVTMLALSLVVLVQTQKLGDAENSPVVEKSGEQSTPVGPPEELMLVSPQGDLKASSTVGADGVTLEETDGVELKPQPRD